MQPSAVASHPVSVNRAPVPHRLKRINRRGNNAARCLAISRGDKADAAGIGFKFGAVHADFGNAGALVLAGHNRSISFRWAWAAAVNAWLPLRLFS